MNYYFLRRYPFWLIHDFARSCRDLSGVINMSGKEVSKSDQYWGVPPTIDALYCFTDHELPALAFQRLPHNDELDGDYQHVYELVYIDPSLGSAWKHAMDREQEEPYRPITPEKGTGI